MPLSSTQGMQMLLQSMLDSQQAMSSKLDAAIERMATRDDIADLVGKLATAVSKGEFDLYRNQQTRLEARVVVLEQNRLPKYFWPAVISVLGLASPVAAVIIAHLWK